MGDTMDFKPLVAADFAFEGFVVDSVVEDFCAAAGEAAETCVHEILQDTADVFCSAADSGEVDDFHSGVAFDMNLGVFIVDGLHHVGVVVEGEPGVETADDMDFGGAGFFCIAGLLADIVDGKFVSTVFAFFAVEVAEFTGECADVGVVEVTVDVVVDLVAVEACFDGMREFAECPEVFCGE